MDFFNSMMYERHPYESKVIYPPIANLIYYFFYLFVPSDIFVAGSVAIRDSQIGRVLIAMYISLTTLGFLYAILKLKKELSKKNIIRSNINLFNAVSLSARACKHDFCKFVFLNDIYIWL